MTANAKNLSTLANVLDDGTNGQFLQSTGSGGIVFADVAAGASVYDSAELLPLSGNDAGDMAYVNSTNRFYINNGTGWYSISLVNTNPNITSVQDASANTTPFTLATDGTATVITITANDPEQVPLTYNYSVTSGSLTNGGGTTATIAQSDNVFTVTPSSTEAYAGTFELTFTASDGINTATNANSFTLEFITIVTNSKYTTLLASVASNSPYSLPSANTQVSSFSVNSQTSSPTEVVFGDSGTKMFVLSSDRYVYSYNLSTAYDASTASYVATSSELTQFTTNTSESFRFKPDGTVMFVSGSNGYVYQYSLTAWDVSTIAYASKSAQHASHAGSYKAITFKPDGTRIYMSSLRYVLSMTLSSPWDLGSTTSDNTSAGFTNAYLNLGWVYGNTITGIDFNSTGTSLTMVYGNNASDKYIIEHPIDDAWNVSNATALGSAPSTTYQQNTIQGLAYANDGNTLVTVLDTGDTVYTYDTGMSGINNNITDASSNSHSVTVTGDAYAGTFSPYRSGGYATSFDGTGNTWFKFPTSTDFNLTDQSFHISFWCYPKELGDYDTIIAQIGTMGIELLSNSLRMWLSTGTNGTWNLLNGAQISNTLNVNEWAYITVVRDTDNNTLKSYHNGTLVYNNTSFTGTVGNSTNSMDIGKYNNSNVNSWNGYIRDLRYRVGTNSENTSNAVPTEAVTSEDSLTKLLTCHSPIISDGSSSARIPEGKMAGGSMTAGWTVTEPFSPYDYFEYSATDHGGAVYFDGGGDSLNTTATQIIPSTSFTVTAWVYLNDTTDGAVWGQGTAGHSGRTAITIDNNNWFAQIGSAQLGLSTSVSANTWYYTDLQWDGSTLKFFVNGSLIGSSNTSNSPTNSALYLGDLGSAWSTGYPLNGYVSDLKVVSGTPSGSSSVPTAPLSSSGASIHIKGTDASILDKAQGGNFKLDGNVTGSTTQVKFAGSKSMYFPGSLGDQIIAVSGENVNLSAADPFTWEAWCYFNSVSGVIHLMSSKDVGYTQDRIAFELRNSKLSAMFGGSVIQSGSQVLSTGQWYHLAISRAVGSPYTTTRFFVNGNLDQTATAFQQAVAIGSFDKWYIGSPTANNIGNGYNEFNGYMQDVRFTEGLTRYTANFTPPTASLEG